MAAQAKFDARWQAFLGFVSQAAEAAKRSGPASSKAAAELGKVRSPAHSQPTVCTMPGDLSGVPHCCKRSFEHRGGF